MAKKLTRKIQASFKKGSIKRSIVRKAVKEVIQKRKDN